MIDITPITQAVIALATALITTFLIPWIRSKTTKEQQEILKDVVSGLCYAAEELYKGSGRGDEKFDYVCEKLEEKGYELDKDTVTELIKEAVIKMRKELEDKTVEVKEVA